MNPVHVECVKPIYNILALSVNKNISINFANGSYYYIVSHSKSLYRGAGSRFWLVIYTM